eukprot:CAMPEP_0201586154 /NCGR_PEP_ID=MMETSP0190_2-20130828/129684_1 /ASSEMBLY_ACC=CAM_ASM_000263 /TAXON_ID=37353 /ORGANISM="Rosalina sp." /LENGTH=232 /DNA_ID=CAMNT_0048033561 /DNA_START=63 /DNA_END=761 /DNA_ORIENTATION=+
MRFVLTSFIFALLFITANGTCVTWKWYWPGAKQQKQGGIKYWKENKGYKWWYCADADTYANYHISQRENGDNHASGGGKNYGFFDDSRDAPKYKKNKAKAALKTMFDDWGTKYANYVNNNKATRTIASESWQTANSGDEVPNPNRGDLARRGYANLFSADEDEYYQDENHQDRSESQGADMLIIEIMSGLILAGTCVIMGCCIFLFGLIAGHVVPNVFKSSTKHGFNADENV